MQARGNRHFRQTLAPRRTGGSNLTLTVSVLTRSTIAGCPQMYLGRKFLAWTIAPTSNLLAVARFMRCLQASSIRRRSWSMSPFWMAPTSSLTFKGFLRRKGVVIKKGIGGSFQLVRPALRRVFNLGQDCPNPY